MSQYLFPCACGKEFKIETSQAGQTVNCEACGESVDLPTMREIRKLPPAEDEVDDQRPAWSDLQGVLFVAGIIITLVGVVLSSVLGVQRLSLETAKPTLQDSPEFDRQVDQWPVDQVFDNWHQIERIGLGARETPRYLQDREETLYWNVLLAGGIAVLLAGIGCLVGAFVIKPKA